jgi:four helix bundle protein
MSTRLHHEDLKVYQQAVAFVAKAATLCEDLPPGYAVKDQLIRAAESVPFNIAVSNAAQESLAQLQSLEYAAASVAECAACLDILTALDRGEAEFANDKRLLLGLYRMLLALRRKREDRLAEEAPEYGEPRFNHERLDCYQQALQLVGQMDKLRQLDRLPARNIEAMDRAATSVVLNLTEGNARWSPKDRARFFGTAATSALRVAAALDIAVARKLAGEEQVAEGKRMIPGVVSQLQGLRRRAMQNMAKGEDED